jgi:hypothetical protein
VKKKFEKRKQNPPKIKIKIKMRVGKYSREKREKDGRAAAAQVFIQLEQFFSYVCVCGSRRNIIHHQTHTHTHTAAGCSPMVGNQSCNFMQELPLNYFYFNIQPT